MVKLWHDDTRPAPDGSWKWTRTNDEARAFLTRVGHVDVASLDHDLGAESFTEQESDGVMYRTEDNGEVLAKWMVERDIVPEVAIVHSWNPAGAHFISTVLRPHCHVVVQPYGTSPNYKGAR